MMPKSTTLTSPKPISRRQAISGMAGAMAAAAGISGAPSSLIKSAMAAGTKKRPPNIVWLIGDDIGREDIGCYGTPVRTPNIDRLASEGVRFENAFSCAPSCSPSRACMYSGLYPHATGIGDHTLPLNENVKILPALLKEKNYFSGQVVKLHLEAPGEKQFDMAYLKYEDIWEKFAKDRPKDRPFFLSVGFTEPHRPYANYPDVGRCAYPENFIPNPHKPSEVHVPPYLPDIPPVRKELALYYDQITYLDGYVGKILGWLESEGLADNTLVLFFADQGKPFPRCKTSLYDSGIGSPLIARWPGVTPADSTQRALFSFVDLTPTMLAAAGIEPPSDLHGQNLIDLFVNPAAKGRELAFAERNWHCIDDHIRAVRSNRFKYIRNYYPGEPFGHPEDIVRCDSYQAMLKLLDEDGLTKEQMNIFRCPRPPEELYDTQADPFEFANLVYKPQYQNQLNQMRAALEAWVRDTKDLSPDDRWKNRINIRTGEQYLGPNLTPAHRRP